MTTRTLLMIGTLTALGLSACGGDKGIDAGTSSDGGATDGGGTTGDAGTTTTGGGGDDCGDDIASACTYAIDSAKGYAIAEDVIDPAGDRDFYKMTLGAGQIIGVGTIAYATTGEGVPDTVLRLYNSAGDLLATNDDMPYRIQETDSALYFQADTDGDYYLEVLEWSDWDAGYDAEGGSTYDYSLVAYEVTQLDPEPDNNTAADMDAYLKSGENFAFYGNFWSDDGTFPYQIQADMDESGDTDLYPLSFDTKDSSAVYCSYSAWPTWYPTLQPSFTLYNGALEVVASTDSPVFDVDRLTALGGFTYNVGLLYKLEAAETYYLEVSDLAGNSGIGTYYSGLVDCFQVSDVVSVEDVDIDNNTPTISSDIVMTESTSTAGYYYGYIQGEFSADSVPADSLDAWRISSGTTGGSLDGKILNVTIQAETIGSFADTAITLYASDGSTVLATASGNSFDDSGDAAIEGLTLDGAGSAVYVSIEAEGMSDVAGANEYYVSVSVEEGS